MENKESWSQYYQRKLVESAKKVMPNICWYLSQEIFAEAPEKPAMHYDATRFLIPLPEPCINKWSLERIEKELGDVKGVIYFSHYIVLSGDLQPGTVLTEKEYAEAPENTTVGIGTKGIVEYAKIAGKKLPGVINDLPVIHLPQNVTDFKEKRFQIDFNNDISELYVRIMNRVDRIKHLEQINAPDIIMRNEKSMLQEHVDQVINGRYTKD